MKTCKIIESIKNGKMYRECSCCKTNVTKETQWMRYKYCPWCGAEVEYGK